MHVLCSCMSLCMQTCVQMRHFQLPTGAVNTTPPHTKTAELAHGRDVCERVLRRMQHQSTHRALSTWGQEVARLGHRRSVCRRVLARSLMLDFPKYVAVRARVRTPASADSASFYAHAHPHHHAARTWHANQVQVAQTMP